MARRLADTIEKLYDVSSEILEQAVELSSYLTDDDNEMVDGICGSRPSLSRQDALTMARQAVFDATSDPKKVHREIGLFSELVVDGDEALETEFDKISFLAQIWSGDAYGVGKIEGLETLLGEFESINEVFDEEYIVKLALAED